MASPARTKPSTVVVQARVSQAVAAKIKATAAVRGVPEAVVIRGWLDEMADKTSTKSLSEQLEQQLLARAQETRALLEEAEQKEADEKEATSAGV